MPGVLIAIRDQHHPFQMVRRKSLKCAIHCGFDVGSALIDGPIFRIVCHRDVFQLIHGIENRGVGAKWYESNARGISGAICLLDPLDGRLDCSRRHTLGNVEHVSDRNPRSGAVNDGLHQCQSKQRDDHRPHRG